MNQYVKTNTWTGPRDGQPWSKANNKYKKDNPITKSVYNRMKKRIIKDGKFIEVVINNPDHPEYDPNIHWTSHSKAQAMFQEEKYKTATDQLPKIMEPVKEAHPMLNKIREEDKEIYAVSDNKQSTLKQGFVYVLSHPKFSPWCKVGHSRDPERRLSTYNTGCPTRSYTLSGYEYFEDRISIEEHIHNMLERDGYPRKGEWFNCPSQHVLDMLKQFPFK